jgi:ABC-type glycerol-3-phosphate transport system permease component
MKVVFRVVLYGVLIVDAVVISIPWIWMILSALKTNVELHNVPLKALPAVPQLSNFYTAFFLSSPQGFRPQGQIGQSSAWLLYFRNTLIIAAFVELGTLLSNSLVAFSFSRLRWPGRNILFFFVLTTMMLPAQVTIIPQYIVLANYFGWVNTWYPMIVPAFFASAWAIFLLRQFMMTTSVEIDEAARLDGYNDFDLYWRVILPMTKPALGAIAIFTFTYVRNDFFTPLLYIRKEELYNVAIGLAGMRNAYALWGERFPRDELTMAASAIVTLPLVILFFAFQRQFIQGVVITGVKG